jgi:transposase InsO family protein
MTVYSERQRQTALARKYCVDRFRLARQDLRTPFAQGVANIIAEARRLYPDMEVSEASIRRWDRLYKRPCDLARLVDRRGGDMRHSASPEAWSAFRDLYLDGRTPSIHQIWQIVGKLAEERGWQWCKYRVCTRNKDRFITKQQQVMVREPTRYRSGLAPFIAQDPESWNAGENFVGDNKALDILVRWGNGFCRPWLTSFQDWRSRKIVGWTLSDSPNSSTILAALRMAILDESNMGPPPHVTVDNGADYCSYVFNGRTKREKWEKVKANVDEGRTAGIFNLLGITAHFCIPFSPNGKARLERWHRTLERFCKNWPTYTGWNAQTKPELLAEYVKKPSMVPTFKEVSDALGDYIRGYNLTADHSIADLAEDGQTLSPSEAYAKWCPVRRVLADPAALDLILAAWCKPAFVNRNGISLTLGGTLAHYGQFSTELMAFKALSKKDRQPVFVTYDPNDLSTIRVFDKNNKFICVAEMNNVGGAACRIDRNAFKEQARKRTAYARAQKTVAEYRLDEMLTPEERIGRAAREQNRQAVADASAQPTSIRIVQTPLDGQGREQQRQELKKTFGGSAMTVKRTLPIQRLLPAPAARPRTAPAWHENPEQAMRELAHAVNQ